MMDRIKTVKVTSRRSAEINKQWFSFEMTLEADVNNMSEPAKKDYIKKLWEYAGEEVDNQFVEVGSIQ